MNSHAKVYRETSPLFNDRKIKLATFCTNLSGGCAITTIDGVLEADWSSTLSLAKLGDAMEFEALVPVGRWHGFGGKTNFNGAGFEAFSWAAGIGASTEVSCNFRHLTRADNPSDHGGQAISDNRPHHWGPLCA